MTRHHLLLLLALAGCSTIERGTTQIVTIQPDPPDAVCTVRQGRNGTVLTTSDNRIEVPRRNLILTVECQKPGYQPAKVLKPAMSSQGPLGGLSYLVDAASGANNSYPPVIQVLMRPDKP